MEWYAVARNEDVGGDGFVLGRAGESEVLLARLSDGSLVAFGVDCPHQGQRLDRGCLWRDTIECPHHHYTYDPHTGDNLTTGADRVPLLTRKVSVYEVRERDSWVEVRAPSP